MTESRPKYQTNRGPGRPANGAYPKKIFARVSEEQAAYLARHYGTTSEGIRAAIECLKKHGR